MCDPTDGFCYWTVRVEGLEVEKSGILTGHKKTPRLMPGSFLASLSSGPIRPAQIDRLG